VTTRAAAVRARVLPAPEPPFDRLWDRLTHDLVTRGPIARERFPVAWSDRDALASLVAAKRAPLAPALAAELREYHQRLGAPAASLAALERLARGEAVCAVAGQQPAPLGGPLYALHKTASTIGLSRRVEARVGTPCVPLFWTHVEDSDFAEIRGATIADATLALLDLTLPDAVWREGGLVGAIAAAPVVALGDRALAAWEGLPGRDAAAALLRQAGARARDLGELHSALVLALFGERGVVVVDPRLPAFRAAARPVLERYLADADAIGEAARRAGDALETAAGKRPLAGPTLDSFVFAIEDGVRHKVTPAEARAAGPSMTLSPSVALRATVQDAVFPTVAMACGPGEIAYLAQLREVFERLGVRGAAVVPRLGATWLPPAAIALIEASGAEPWEVVVATDAVLRAEAERGVPAEVSQELQRGREGAAAALERFARAAARVDPSLPQMVESARGKVDFQFARLLDGVVGKVRHRLERERPEWPRLRYYVAPGDKLQERRLASLEPVARRGAGVTAELADLAEEHAEALERGIHHHLLIDLP
jgi:uncharacterized protein YllA (UPF0747 family)